MSVSLTMTNGTGSALRSVLATEPLVQREAGTSFSLDRTPQPRSYPMLLAGNTAVFQWQGHLNSSGTVGISVAAAAVGPNGETVNTPQVDCGTIGAGPQPAPAGGPDTTVCTECNSSAAVAFITAKWATGPHASTNGPAQSNTFCASCHSPLQATVGAGPRSNEPIAAASWQGVTCAVCHASEAQRTAWKTPIAVYDVATRSYAPVPLGDADVLCTHCHTGEHGIGFQGYGVVMHEAAVRCIDCHMAPIPADDPSVGQRPAHDFKVVANLPYSCGTYPGGCHTRRPESWAVRILALGPIHTAPQGE